MVAAASIVVTARHGRRPLICCRTAATGQPLRHRHRRNNATPAGKTLAQPVIRLGRIGLGGIRHARCTHARGCSAERPAGGRLFTPGDLSGLEPRLSGRRERRVRGLAAADAAERTEGAGDRAAAKQGWCADGQPRFAFRAAARRRRHPSDRRRRGVRAARFETCLPSGCLVPLAFDTAAIARLRAGTALKVKVKGTDQKELALTVSLKGLAAALDRLKVLAGG